MNRIKRIYRILNIRNEDRTKKVTRNRK